jgi:type II restriction/modification system DNA methylase subunit YeeA
MQTPNEFITKWKASTLKERSASQEHFLDICRLIGHPTPAQSDPIGEHFTFERGASKTGSGQGWADVWKKGCFAWEYKGKKKDLNAAFAQLQRYAIALENPPLLVVSDMETIIIHTNWTNTVQVIHTIAIEDLEQPEAMQKLKWLFTDPERFKPGVTREMITEKAASSFAGITQHLRDAGHNSRSVAHFVTKLLFCMFSEDVCILPDKLFTRTLEACVKDPARFQPMAQGLFSAMKSGGLFGVDEIPWFNGGLFEDDEALPLDAKAIKLALAAARLDWSDIEPAIFGTLFERGLDPSKRSQLGAHYTDRQSIMRIVGPVVIDPLAREWDEVKSRIFPLLEKETAALLDVVAARKNTDAQKEKLAKARATSARKAASILFYAFLDRLKRLRVLDPACGSGNFLYVSLVELKNLEHRVMIEAEAMGFHPEFLFQIGPWNVLGLEINEYATELARVTVWIGELQWMIKHGMPYNTRPVLQTMDQIACRDALITADGLELMWPDADFIVGNPPFLGGSKMLGELGGEYVTQLRKVYAGRVPGGADLVTYWFEKARKKLETGTLQRVGFVATNSIRAGSNREVLKRICDTGRIFNTWGDEPWVNEGAAVRVSLICFNGNGKTTGAILDGIHVAEIYADLTAPKVGTTGLDLTTAKSLTENTRVCIKGSEKGGPFDITGEQVRQWLMLPNNPNGRHNSDVLRPWANGMDVTRRPSDTWLIDFSGMTEATASLYEAPFEYALRIVKPARSGNRESRTSEKWWLHRRSGEELRTALTHITRCIATSRVAKHRLFVWLDKSVLPDSRLYAICRDDETIFGILHSRYHELWSLKTCSWHGVGNDPTYNAASCFETFPFPEGLTPNIPAADYADNPHAQAIASAARRLVELRDAWLNPPEWIRREPEVIAGYPDRILPANEAAAVELKKRTLTNLYNQRPTWLNNLHCALDEAVAAAYGWEADISDDEVLSRLLKLNKERTEGH